jgi:hypothetical protein
VPGDGKLRRLPVLDRRPNDDAKRARKEIMKLDVDRLHRPLENVLREDDRIDPGQLDDLVFEVLEILIVEDPEFASLVDLEVAPGKKKTGSGLVQRYFHSDAVVRGALDLDPFPTNDSQPYRRRDGHHEMLLSAPHDCPINRSVD